MGMQHALVVSHCVLRKLGHCPWTILFDWRPENANFINMSKQSGRLVATKDKS